MTENKETLNDANASVVWSRPKCIGLDRANDFEAAQNLNGHFELTTERWFMSWKLRAGKAHLSG